MALRNAVRGGYIDATKLLIDNGSDVNNAVDVWKSSILHVAVNTHNIDIVRLLLDHGAHVDVQDKFNRTPLWLASCYRSQINIVCLLLDRGASADLLDNEYMRTPLRQAIRNGNTEIVRLLINRI